MTLGRITEQRIRHPTIVCMLTFHLVKHIRQLRSRLQTKVRLLM